MSQIGGKVCQFILTHLSITFEVVGSLSLGYGVWLKKNANNYEKRVPNAFLFPMFVWILIVQGSLMVTMGIYGIYIVWMKKTIGLKVFCVLLAILALTDIVTGMILYFKCTEHCPVFPKLVLGMFLGTAALLTVTLICHIVFRARVRVDITAH